MDWLPEGWTVDFYLDSCINLLGTWSWLYKERAVNLLKTGTMDSLPAANLLSFISKLEVHELNEVPYGLIKDEWPDVLKQFVAECFNLKLNIPEVVVEYPTLKNDLLKGMSPKKKMEAIKLAAVVSEICGRHGIKHVVDIGSGLGYVDKLLCQVYDITVLGIEKDRSKVDKANEMGEGVDFIEAYLSEESMSDLAAMVTRWLSKSPACFIALHACGDLSIHVQTLFEAVEDAKCQLIVPCCYHLSTLRPLTTKVKNSGIVNTNLLRIASDSTSERWRQTSEEQHLLHAKNVLARALIELFPLSGVEMKKKHRHLMRSFAKGDWEQCLEKCLERVTGINEEKIQKVWKNEEWRTQQIESYTCLQICLQGVAEGLTLSDNVAYIKDRSNLNVTILKLFDTKLSPRSNAFFVEKI